MKLTENDFKILVMVARYYALSAPMLHCLCFAHRKDQRHTRRRLSELARHRLIRKSTANVAFSTGNSGPVYTPTHEGCEALSVFMNDDAWLATYTRPPRLDRLYHWLDCSWAHTVIDQSCQQCPAVERVDWVNEWAPIADADGNPNGYVLHTQFRENPPLSCSPDAAFLLEVAGHRRVYYIEVDRGTSGPTRVAASKVGGYSELLLTQGHRRHYPATTCDDFTVLLITIDDNHRDRIQREVARHTQHNPELWLFTHRNEFTKDSALLGSIYKDHDGQLGPLLDLPETTSVDSSHDDSPESARASHA